MQTHQFPEEQNKTFRWEGRTSYLKKVYLFIENYFSKNEHAKPEKRSERTGALHFIFVPRQETKAEAEITVFLSVNPELDR